MSVNLSRRTRQLGSATFWKGRTTMLKSRTMAVAGMIAALSLVATPFAAASVDAHSGASHPDRIQRVDKRSPDTHSRDRADQRDLANHR